MKTLRLILSLLICAALALSLPAFAQETEPDRKIIVVSLGDSYSSGEGLMPFYGQDAPLSSKVLDQDWLGHRSERSWPGRLRFSGIDGTLSEHRGKYVKNEDGSYTLVQDGQWFFVSTTGALCANLFEKKEVQVAARGDSGWLNGLYYVDPQLEIFDALAADGLKADYVTMTLGGNDMEFPTVLMAAILSGPILGYIRNMLPEQYKDLELHKLVDSLWKDFYEPDGRRQTLKTAYRKVAEAAGPQATIILVGYPTLLGEANNSFLFSKENAAFINESTRRLNGELEAIAGELREEGVKIYFVSVEEEFAGKEAYSGAEEEYIERVVIGAGKEDFNQLFPIGFATIHPTEAGAQAYARSVQAFIDELEAGGIQ